MRGAFEQNPNVSDERMADRADAYRDIMSHGFRSMYFTIDTFRSVDEWDDEKIARNPQTIRMMFRELLKEADECYQWLKGCYEVSDEYLDDYTRAYTQPQWRKLMEESGMEWATDVKGGRWVRKKDG